MGALSNTEKEMSAEKQRDYQVCVEKVSMKMTVAQTFPAGRAELL